MIVRSCCDPAAVLVPGGPDIVKSVRWRCNVGDPSDDVADVTEAEMAPAGVEQLFREQRLPLLRLAYLMCGSRDLCEDIVQTAFASVHQRWATIEDPAAYLRRSVVNQAKDAQRRSYRRLRLLGFQTPEPITHMPEIDETWRLIRGLPAVQRAVIVLHYYEDLPLVEIADLLDRPASTVRSDLRRALEQLRKALT